jgi:PIN domain nuclease of toxin-antitoxin system
MTYVIDTHTLIWFAEGNSRLSATAKAALTDVSAQIVVPSMALVEARYLFVAKRIKISLTELYQEVLNLANCTIYPLDEEVVNRIPENLNIHDAIITATALVYREVMGHQVNLITKDRRIRDSKLIDVLW